jgi:hypothetical protein
MIGIEKPAETPAQQERASSKLNPAHAGLLI